MDHSKHNEHAGHKMPDHSTDETHMDHSMHNEQMDHSSHAAESDHAGHDEHAGHTDHSGHEQMFRTRFWGSLALSIPVLFFSPMIQDWLNFTAPSFTGSEWIPFIFSLVIFAYGGVPFINMAKPEIRSREPGMMTLISLAISVAFVYSLAAQLFDLGEGFFWELVTLIDIMLLGHWMEMRSVRQASGALNELAKLMPDEAELVTSDGNTKKVSVSELKNDDVVLVRPGASVPADGQVVDGESSVNESMITGESKPVDKGIDSKVIAGTINGDGSLRVRVTATGDQTALAGIMRLVDQAQKSKSKTQLLADQAAGWLFYIALGVAALTAIAWIIAVGFNIEVLKRVVTVLVIACPHALGLAVPLVVAITTSIGASNGILIRNRLALEAARDINVVVFDKTGTLTEGKFGVVGIETEGWDEDRALALAAAIEGDSEHLIARAIRNASDSRKSDTLTISNFSAIKGRGVQAVFEGKTVYMGGPRLLEILKTTPSSKLSNFADNVGRRAQSVVYLVVEKDVVAAFAVADVIRAESKQAVERLHAMGVEEIGKSVV